MEVPTIVQALGLQSSSRAPLELRHSALREQHLLLVLDTFEQVIAAAPLLCACWTKRFLWPADLLIEYPKEGWFVMGPQSQFA